MHIRHMTLRHEILQKKYKGILCFGWKITAEFDRNVRELNALLRHFVVGQIIIEDLNRAGALCLNVLTDDKVYNSLLDER